MALTVSDETRAAAALLAWYDRHRRDLPWRAGRATQQTPIRSGCPRSCCSRRRSRRSNLILRLFWRAGPTSGYLAAGAPRGRDAGLGRAWLLFARPQSSRLRANRRGRVRRPVSAIEAALRALPGHWPLHGGGDRGDRFRAARGRDRRQCHAGRRAALCDRNAAPGRQAAIKARVEAMVPGAPAGRFRASHDGPWRHGLHAKKPPLRPLSLAGHFAGAGRRVCAGSLPRKAPRPQRPLRQGAAFFVRRRDGAVLVRTRPQKGLLGGMVELPGSSWETEFDEAQAASPGAAQSGVSQT